jgi:hypothetical protein
MFCRRILSCILVFTTAFVLATPAFAQDTESSLLVQNRAPQVIYENQHDTSAPLSELVNFHRFVIPTSLTEIPLRHATENVPVTRTTPARDPVLQASALGASVPASNLLTFDGISGTGFVPPDPNLAVGATQIVQTVNTSFGVFTKSGSLVLQSTIQSLWSNFGGSCQTGPNFSDPIVLYDKPAGRWLITQFAFDASLSFSNSVECIAVSTSSDATGSYNRYAFSISGLGDYPKFGVWPDAYYASYNLFTVPGYAEPVLCAYNRSAMLTGGTANSVCFAAGNTTDFTYLPSDLDGSTAPPAGEPAFYLELPRHLAGSTPTSVNLVKFHVDWTNTANSHLTGPTSISVAQYTEACNTCVPQLGTSQTLDSLGDRLMHRLAYRNFGDHEALVATHSVVAGSSIGLRWYEIRSPNGTPVVFQQGTYFPDSSYRWMGSIAMDKSGDIALGYSVSSASIFPSIRFTGRPPQKGLGLMEAETTIIAGGGAQLPTTCGNIACGNRWGDYSSMAIDPTDDLTFAYTNEYYATSGGASSWRTRIATFKLGPFLIASFSPTSLNFGSRLESDPPVTLTDTFTNNGVQTLNISSVGQGLIAPFTLVSKTCGSTLAQGASCTVTVKFDPSQASIGINNGTLSIVDNGDNSPQKLPLSGTMRCPPAGCL